MVFKLDVKDKKLLTLLDKDARLSNSQLARQVGLSKPAIEYRLKRLDQQGVIFSFYTVIDFARLGFSQYKIYFKLQNATLSDEEAMIDYWKKDDHAVWVAEVRGRWDLAVSIFADSNFAFGKIIDAFMRQFSSFILEKDVLLTEYSPIYAREYLTDTESSLFTYAAPSKEYDLDKVDTQVIKAISTDARISIIDLARKTGLTRDVVHYRLKKLTKDNIIIQHRCYLNLSAIGINHYKIIFRTKNLDEKSEQEFAAFVSEHKKATQFLKLIGSWDLEVEFETENEDELYSILAKMRKHFSKIIRDFDILRVTATMKYDFFPFTV
ncbi:MAG: Lrp/AsnC family transcriptional regulator [Nanoarchaeota archaeon]